MCICNYIEIVPSVEQWSWIQIFMWNKYSFWCSHNIIALGFMVYVQRHMPAEVSNWHLLLGSLMHILKLQASLLLISSHEHVQWHVSPPNTWLHCSDPNDSSVEQSKVADLFGWSLQHLGQEQPVIWLYWHLTVGTPLQVLLKHASCSLISEQSHFHSQASPFMTPLQSIDPWAL